jgi:uncharacterized membrane protein
MRSAALTLALLILLSGAAPATALVPTGVDDGPEPAIATGPDGQPDAAQLDSDPPLTEINIQLEADGDARWTIAYRYALTDRNEVEAFRELGEEYEAGRADVGFDVGVFRTVAERASEATDRGMQIRDVERSASVERRVTTANTTDPTATTANTTEPTATTAGPGSANATGVLRLSFTWTNFLAQPEDGTLRLGDVFTTPDGGTWLSSLAADQRLTVATPPGYVISRTSFPVQTQNGSLVIDGPREFTAEERLSVIYQQNAGAEIPWTLIVGGAVAAVVVLGLVYALSRRRSGSAATAEPAPDGTAMTNGGEATTEPDGTAGGSSATTATGPADDTDAAGPSADGTPTDEEPDLELLSDEERVEYLLRERGGRMKQANIVKETGWSDAKVSQLLSSMADAGRVEKLRLGRENLISLPDDDRDDRDGQDEG